jgi:antitoxin component YwqK of YwqJK toxin-antitoxin module
METWLENALKVYQNAKTKYYYASCGEKHHVNYGPVEYFIAVLEKTENWSHYKGHSMKKLIGGSFVIRHIINKFDKNRKLDNSYKDYDKYQVGLHIGGAKYEYFDSYMRAFYDGICYVRKGFHMSWFDSGKILAIRNYIPKEKNGNKGRDYESHGASVRYYENGIENERAYYEHGKLHGEYKSYQENGIPSWFCEFKEGNMVGISKEWDDDGNINTITIRDDDIGNRHVIKTTYWPNGRKASYREDIGLKQCGIFCWWDENGDIINEIDFTDGDKSIDIVI